MQLLNFFLFYCTVVKMLLKHSMSTDCLQVIDFWLIFFVLILPGKGNHGNAVTRDSDFHPSFINISLQHGQMCSMWTFERLHLHMSVVVFNTVEWPSRYLQQPSVHQCVPVTTAYFSSWWVLIRSTTAWNLQKEIHHSKLLFVTEFSNSRLAGMYKSSCIFFLVCHLLDCTIASKSAREMKSLLVSSVEVVANNSKW